MSKLPKGFTELMEDAKREAEPFWHIYLDNFAAGQRVAGPHEETLGGQLHRTAEAGWNARGVVTAAAKSTHRATEATELGAKIHGEDGWLGVDTHRLLKVVKLSLWLAFRPNVRAKTLQITMGRWMHVLQFRRPAMSHFVAVWDFFSLGKRRREWQARFELLTACFGALLFHTDLTTRPCGTVGASDSSMKGGAVGMSTGLTDLGRDFLNYEADPERQGPTIPILVISCFDGIGGCMRAYNVAGVRPQLYVSIEIHRPARRVSSRRWPEIVEVDDVTQVSEDDIRQWVTRAGAIEQIHLWGGFPCKDLSSAKHRRANLKGEHSGLFYELKRIWGLVRSVGNHLKTLIFAENVCSMDKEARDLISWELGLWPLRVDSEALVPLSRPRFVWTNMEPTDTDSMWREDKEGFTQVHFVCDAEWPTDWIQPGCTQYRGPVVYPTCMRAIPRDKPPERPVGVHRCTADELMRWRQDQFRFPPYQYKDAYMIEDTISGSLRYLVATEREQLLGYGWGHTLPAMSASAAKSTKRGYEDERLSLLGDSFPVNTFWYFSAQACQQWVPLQTAQHYRDRLGLWPGACTHIQRLTPIGTTRPFGSTWDECWETEREEESLVRQLARRTTHTGSDIRISTGIPTCPKVYPRQAIPSDLWEWKITLARKWDRHEHINCLELRSILLALQWRLERGKLGNMRLLQLSDSAVSISILCKGRTSSKALQHVVRKIGALVLMANAMVMYCHVDSMNNPTDDASRS